MSTKNAIELKAPETLAKTGKTLVSDKVMTITLYLP